MVWHKFDTNWPTKPRYRVNKFKVAHFSALTSSLRRLSGYSHEATTTTSSGSRPIRYLEAFKGQLNVPFFMEIFVVMCWCIWRRHIQSHPLPSIQSCRSLFKTEFALVILKTKDRLSTEMKLWLEAKDLHYFFVSFCVSWFFFILGHSFLLSFFNV